MKRRRSARGYIAFALVCAVCVLASSSGHPHDDAYMAMKYADNLAEGHGIAFWAGGPHAEGATEFLYMLLLSLFRSLHFPIPSGAAPLVTSIAASFAARSIAPPSMKRPLALIALVLLAASPAALMSALGFGTLAFATASLAAWAIVARGRPRELTLLPLLLLILALLRPDGVILALGFLVLGAMRAKRLRCEKTFAAYAVLAVCGGIGYFIWRRSYFSGTMPLALVVQSHDARTFPGARDVLDWVVAMLVPFAVLGAALRWLGRRRRAVREHVIALAPFALHIASFVFTAPLENVGHRLYAPATLAVAACTLVAISFVSKKHIAPFAAALILAAVPEGALAMRALRAAAHPGDGYLTNLALALPKVAPSARIATTEAGRLGFYAEGPVVDLVGLNTKETALAPPTVAFLDTFDPDLVIVSPAMVVEIAALGPPSDVVRIDKPLAPRDLGSTDVSYAESKLDNVRGATLGTARWLDQRRDRYDVYLVHTHIVAIKRGMARSRLYEAVVTATKSPPPSLYKALSH